MKNQLKWDRRFLRLAAEVSSWSKDPSTKVGAVLVGEQRRVVGLGYNGFPRGMIDFVSRYEDREFKYENIVHAEVNAILSAGHLSQNATIYVWPAFGFPCICSNCCKAAIQAGVRRIVGAIDHTLDPERAARWADSLASSRQMCEEAGVTWSAIEMEDDNTN